MPKKSGHAEAKNRMRTVVMGKFWVTESCFKYAWHSGIPLHGKKPTANQQEHYFRYQFIFLESTAKDHHTIDFNCDDSKQQKTSQNRHDHFPFMR